MLVFGGDEAPVQHLLSAQAVWDDVLPSDYLAEAPACVDIQVSDEYKDTYGLLYACIERGEKSERVLALTERCILMCSGHYTAWDYRFQCLEALDADMEKEWQLCYEISRTNCKNYQLWNHRRRCALRMGASNAQRELEFAVWALQQDSKNYHVWAHRQVLVSTYGLWDQEWAYVECMLSEDIRNNSAWNQRAWLLLHYLEQAISLNVSALHSLACSQGGQGKCMGAASPTSSEQHDDKEVKALGILGLLQREESYVFMSLEAVPHNESAWNYLCGVPFIVLQALRQQCDQQRGILPPDSEGTMESKVPSSHRMVIFPVGGLQSSAEEGLCEAVSAFAQASLNVALEAVKAHPACIPARAALLWLLRQEAVGNKDAAARQIASENVGHISRALQVMDPLHRYLYAALEQDCIAAMM